MDYLNQNAQISCLLWSWQWGIVGLHLDYDDSLSQNLVAAVLICFDEIWWCCIVRFYEASLSRFSASTLFGFALVPCMLLLLQELSSASMSAAPLRFLSMARFWALISCSCCSEYLWALWCWWDGIEEHSMGFYEPGVLLISKWLLWFFILEVANVLASLRSCWGSSDPSGHYCMWLLLWMRMIALNLIFLSPHFH